MKQTLWLALLILAVPVAGFANSQVDFGNDGGTLSGSNAGLSMTGSVLTTVIGLNGLGTVTGKDLGSVSFTTGSLKTGSLQWGGTFNAGGSFTITGNGTDGIPDGTIFSGSFSGPVYWKLITLKNNTHEYTLTGTVSGTWYNGWKVGGTTVQLTVDIGKKCFTGKGISIASGNTNIVLPETGTLGLLGTGLIGIAGLVRRRLRA